MLIVKLSGKALNDDKALFNLFSQFKDEKFMVVHGGGVEVDHILKALNFETTKLDGIRVSPKEQMPYIAGALAGQCNKILQGVAVSAGLKAFGMLCTDFGLCKLSMYPQEYGFVANALPGDKTTVDTLIAQGQVPVISSIGLNEKGELCNINADMVAEALANMYEAPLIYLSDVMGVLDAKKAVIPEIDENMIQNLVDDGTITEGMAVKVKCAAAVAKKTGEPVYIGSIFDTNAINDFTKLRRIGTTIRAQ